MFTDPEVASFGLSETGARQLHGDQIGIGIERFRGVAKARAIDETTGFIKIITGPDRIDTYQHVLPGMQAEAARTFEQLINEQRPETAGRRGGRRTA